MAIAADFGYGHGLDDTFQGKAHDISFGCSKAGPATNFNGLRQHAMDCNASSRLPNRFTRLPAQEKVDRGCADPARTAGEEDFSSSPQTDG
jgi:hypothetical protein